jgi:hypothetical protein
VLGDLLTLPPGLRKDQARFGGPIGGAAVPGRLAAQLLGAGQRLTCDAAMETASHVRSILNKLGFASRAQIAAWLASSDR